MQSDNELGRLLDFGRDEAIVDAAVVGACALAKNRLALEEARIDAANGQRAVLNRIQGDARRRFCSWMSR